MVVTLGGTHNSGITFQGLSGIPGISATPGPQTPKVSEKPLSSHLYLSIFYFSIYFYFALCISDCFGYMESSENPGFLFVCLFSERAQVA